MNCKILDSEDIPVYGGVMEEDKKVILFFIRVGKNTQFQLFTK